MAKKKAPYIVARCTQAGVHAGELVSKKYNGNGTCSLILRNARRLWYWSGAASLSELAVYGSKTPNTCKFASMVSLHEVTDCCEIIYTQPAGENMIRSQPEWRA